MNYIPHLQRLQKVCHKILRLNVFLKQAFRCLKVEVLTETFLGVSIKNEAFTF